MESLCCLKVDVDTHDGMRDGVPSLLRTFARYDVRATFLLSFGPDNAGKAILNVIRQPGFLRKMLKTGAPKLYGWRTILSGTLLPARPIATAFPELVRSIADAGHEVGVHAWDHRRWQDKLLELSPAEVEEQVRLACDAFAEIMGRPTRSMGAPAWYASAESLRCQDRRGLLYASDMRGGVPGFPEVDGYASTTLQIPSTQPCLEELLTAGHRDPSRWVDMILAPPEEPVGALVIPVHAEVEGGVYREFLEELLERLARDYTVITMEEYAERLLGGERPPRKPAALRALEGRASPVLTFTGPAIAGEVP